MSNHPNEFPPLQGNFFSGIGIPARLRVHNRSHDRTIDRIKLDVELRDPPHQEDHTEALQVEPQQSEERQIGPATDYDVEKLTALVHCAPPHPEVSNEASLDLGDLPPNRGIVLCEVYAFQDQAIMRTYLIPEDGEPLYVEVSSNWT